MSAKEDPSSLRNPKRRANGKLLGQEKRRRFQAKQQQLQQREVETQQRELAYKEWVQQNQSMAHFVSEQDVDRARTTPLSNQESASSPVASLLRPYLDLQQQGQAAAAASPSNESLFIAEGTETVRLLIQQSAAAATNRISIQSIFCKPSLLLDPPVQLVADLPCNDDNNKQLPFHVLLASKETQSAVAGFNISRGALACGVIPHYDEAWFESFLKQQQGRCLRLLALDGICDTANLGAMVRCASAFGIHAMLLSRSCCDAWQRKAVRTSMGHVARVPIVRVDDLASTLQRLSTVTSYAAVVDPQAELVLEQMERGAVPHAWCCVMGNEGTGISPPVIKACTHTLRIDMAAGVDSLSVPIATGILLHGLKEREWSNDDNKA